MIETDILIVGGGIAGASLGAALAGRRRVMLIEREANCGHHSTGRSAAFWLESYGGPAVAPLSRASHDFLAGRGWLKPRGAIHISRLDEFDALPPLAALDRVAMEQRIPGLRPTWRHGREEPGCSDIDVAALHGFTLATLRRAGGEVRTEAQLVEAVRDGAEWRVMLSDGSAIRAEVLVNAAGAWADKVAAAAGVRPLGIVPKRRTMVQLRVGRSGLKDLPLVIDAHGQFYFKGEGDRTIWLSPHDEIDCAPCDAAPEEVDVARAIDRFQAVVDWPVEALERRWAGLRSFAPDRVPIYGYDLRVPDFFWCAGQGGFGIQTAPAAAALAAALLLGETPNLDPAPYDPARFGDLS
jgi:D-arginine dehydrogenase